LIFLPQNGVFDTELTAYALRQLFRWATQFLSQGIRARNIYSLYIFTQGWVFATPKSIYARTMEKTGKNHGKNRQNMEISLVH